MRGVCGCGSAVVEGANSPNVEMCQMRKAGKSHFGKGAKWDFPEARLKAHDAETKPHCRQVWNMIYQKCLVLRLFYIPDI